MADFLTKRERSALMSRVRSKGNFSTELRFVSILRKANIKGWRRNYPLLGKPDFIFLSNRVAIFIDGCFWHGCPKHYKPTASNKAFWSKKIERNKLRDRAVTRKLRSKGWHVLRYWQHSLRVRNELNCVHRLKRALQ